AGLERDIGHALGEADQRLALIDAIPAEALQPLQQGAHPVIALISDGAMAGLMKEELLVLRSDPPFGRGFATRLQIGDQLAPIGNDLVARVGSYRHRSPRRLTLGCEFM